MLVQRCEGEVRDKAPLSDPSRVGVSRRTAEHVRSQVLAKDAQHEIRSSLTILSGGGLLPTRHSSLPLECLTACCVASAVMIGGPGVRKSRQREQRNNKREDIFLKH